MVAKDVENACRDMVNSHALAQLWAQWLASTANPNEAYKQASEQSLNTIEGIYEQGPVGDQGHEVTQVILHHTEGFWKLVRGYLTAMRPS